MSDCSVWVILKIYPWSYCRSLNMTGQIWKWKSPLWFIRHFKGQTVSIPKVGLHVFPFLTAHFLVWTTCTFWLDCTLKLYYGSCLRSLVDVRFRVRQLSCLQNDRQTDRQTERPHNVRLVGGGNNNCLVYILSDRTYSDACSVLGLPSLYVRCHELSQKLFKQLIRNNNCLC